MNQPTPVPPTAEFKDRHVGLIVFGILMILIGCVCALFVPLMILGQAFSAKATGGEANYRMIIPGALMYAGLAVAFVWLGIGSIKARRWARALLLILSWFWLLTGIITIGFMAVFLPSILTTPPPGGQPMPEAARAVAMIVALGFMSVLFIVLPGGLILFYQSRHTKATCEARDPVPRWTDACPLPVLALSLMLGFGVASMLPMLFFNPSVLPFFGQLLTGVTATVLMVAVMALWAWCAWATYHLKPVSWWVVLIGFVVMMTSTLLTFAQVDMIEMYRLMGYPEQQIEQVKQFSFLKGNSLLLLMSLWSFPFLGYLIYVRKYFRPPTHGPAT